MAGLRPDWLRQTRKRCIDSDRRVWQRGDGGQDNGRAGCSVPLEPVGLQCAHFGEGAGKASERHDQDAASLTAAMPARQTPGQ